MARKNDDSYEDFEDWLERVAGTRRHVFKHGNWTALYDALNQVIEDADEDADAISVPRWKQSPTCRHYDFQIACRPSALMGHSGSSVGPTARRRPGAGLSGVSRRCERTRHTRRSS